MSLALSQAKEALVAKEVPVGCVFVLNDQKPIGWGQNRSNETKNATQHAELVAIDQVISWCTEEEANLNDIFPNCSVYVTVEPCIMCAAALQQLKVRKIVFGCRNERFGGVTSVLRVLNSNPDQMEVVEGLRKNDAVDLLKRFYAEGNPNTTGNKSE